MFLCHVSFKWNILSTKIIYGQGNYIVSNVWSIKKGFTSFILIVQLECSDNEKKSYSIDVPYMAQENYSL